MKKYKFLSLFAVVLAVASGCKDYLDINTNPNAPTVTVPGLVLSGALKSTADRLAVDNNDYAAYWVGMGSASGTYSPSGDVRRIFNINSASNRVLNLWANYYLNASNYKFVEVNAGALGTKYGYFVAIAKIMKAYDFQVLVDNYGSIPYDDALKGFQALSPGYTDGSTVYEKLSGELNKAVALIQAGQAAGDWTVPPATVDIMFAGQMGLWAKLANTMNLRLLLHQSELHGAKDTFITNQIDSITTNAAGFLGTGENALINPGYQKAANLQNPFWEAYGLDVGGSLNGGGASRDYFRSSEYGVNFFTNNNDARLDRIFRNVGDDPGVSNGTTYKGIPFGQDADNNWITPVTSGWGLGVMGSPGDPMVFLSAAESQFLQAEAVHRGWITGDETALYYAGITESFDLLGAGTPSGAFLAQPSIVFPAPGSAAALKSIMIQKWAAEYVTDAMEAWTDLRRLGYPDDLPPSATSLAKANPTPPIRLLYPQTEYSNNTGSVNAVISKESLGEKYQFNTPIFWDITP